MIIFGFKQTKYGFERNAKLHGFDFFWELDEEISVKKMANFL